MESIVDGYYQRRKQAMQEERELGLRKAMEEIALTFPGYDYRRVTRALIRAGWKVNMTAKFCAML